jgi:hypothetical protein
MLEPRRSVSMQHQEQEAPDEPKKKSKKAGQTCLNVQSSSISNAITGNYVVVF